jgi:hypothetical protein
VDLLDRQRQQVQRRLQAWAGFPAEQHPRLLVVLSPAAVVGSADGAQGERAFSASGVEAVPGFPEDVLLALRAYCCAEGGPSVLATIATLKTAEFATDRGSQRLAAWEIHARPAPSPIWVLAPSVSQRVWHPPGLEEHELVWRGTTAMLHPDGRTFRLQFPGIPRAFADYVNTEVHESGGAVAVIPVPKDIGPSGPRALLAQQRSVTVCLAEPLASRVLLDANGTPVVVQDMAHAESQI